MLLDERLSWTAHVDRVVERGAAIFSVCRRMFGFTWELQSRVVRWLYTAIVCLQMTYAVEIWWPALDRKYRVRTLN